MIDAPPSDAGAAHDRITCASPAFAVSPVGAPGAAVIRSELWFAVNVGTPAALPPAITTGQPTPPPPPPSLPPSPALSRPEAFLPASYGSPGRDAWCS